MLALYGLLQLISNFIAWLLPVEEQPKYQFLKLATWKVWLIGTPILTLLLITLIIRSAFKVIAARDAEHASSIQGLKRKYIRRRRRINRKFMAERFTLGQYAKELSDMNFERGNLEDRAIALSDEVGALKTERDKLKVELQAAWDNHWKEQDKLADSFRADIALIAAERDALKSLLDERNKHKLTFDIDTKQTRVRVNKGAFGCYLEARIKLGFYNSDLHPLTIKDLKLTLHERGDAGATRLIKTELLANHVFHPDDNLGALTRKGFEPMSIVGRNPPSFYWFIAELSVEAHKLSDFTDKNPLLRMTMEAQNQPPLVVGMDVDWERALIGFTRVFISNG